MNSLGRWAFLAGLVLAVIVGLFFCDNQLIPWLVAALGVLVGLLNIKPAELRSFLVAGIAVTVALISIQAQPYNPAWLTYVVLYVKVFITHALLLVGFFAFFRAAYD